MERRGLPNRNQGSSRGGGTGNRGGNNLRPERSFQSGNPRGSSGSTRSYGGSPARGRSSTVVRFETVALPWDKPSQNPPKCVWKPNFTSDKENPVGVNEFPRRKLDSGARNFVKEINIVLNHFPVKINFPRTIYHYEITMERVRERELTLEDLNIGGRQQERGLPQYLRRRILHYLVPVLQNQFGNSFGIISDFSNLLYSTKELEHMERFVAGDRISDDPRSTFKVIISPLPLITDTTNLSVDVNNMRGVEITEDLKNLQPIYGALIRCINLNAYTPVKQTHLINYAAQPHPLGGGLVSFPGYNVVLSVTNGWKKFINIEISNLATYLDGPITSVLKDILSDGRNRSGSRERDVTTWRKADFDKASDLLKTCKITYESKPGRRFTKVVEGISQGSVSQTKFNYNGQIISVYEYFTRVNGITLKDRDGPCLELRGPLKPKVPAEICNVKKGQSYNRKLNESQIQKIAEKSRLMPGNLQPAINSAVGKLTLGNNPLLETYGVGLANIGQMQEVKARVLAPPQLCYGKQTGTSDANKRAVIIPENGVWDIWGPKFEFFTSSNIRCWGILNLAGGFVDQMKANSFAQQLTSKASTRGITISEPIHYKQQELPDTFENWSSTVETLTTTLEEFHQKFQNEKDEKAFVLVILPKKGSYLYNQVKQAAELDVGILTQCVVASNMVDMRRLDSVVGNIMLKLNSKLTNRNHVVLAPPNFPISFSIFNYPTIIIGADVTHPPPGSSKTNEKGQEIGPPSFAAVTASIDRTGMPYMMQIQAQMKANRGSAEVITGLEEIMVTFLKRYREQTKQIPVKIIYFRDGVGDSQFQEVLRTEMSAIRRACTTLHHTYKPSITFITVQKRHKTRMFMPSGNTYDNAPPGTVVDTDIVHPVENDFYLLSHKGILGTSRPTRYHLLWDDSDFPMNEIQTMAYFLCYMYVRCNRAVSIPAPTYYAHWAAKRAEILSRGWTEELCIDEINRRLRSREELNGFADTYPMHFV